MSLACFHFSRKNKNILNILFYFYPLVSIFSQIEVVVSVTNDIGGSSSTDVDAAADADPDAKNNDEKIEKEKIET